VRNAIWVLALFASAYALLWGVTWLIGDRTDGVFGVTQSGVAYSFYPGVFLGGLPPTLLGGFGVPQIVATVVGGVGLGALITRGPGGPR
jgi:hypothetical protein